VLFLGSPKGDYLKAYGHRSLEPRVEDMTPETVFDLASLTKVLATAPSVLWLMEKGWVELDAPVERYLPEFGANGKMQVTVRHLLTHTSGLRPGISLQGDWSKAGEAYRRACLEELRSAPGSAFVYSDINFIVL